MRKFVYKTAAILLSSAFLFTGCTENNTATTEQTETADSGIEIKEESGAKVSGAETAIDEPQEKEEKSVGVIQFEKEQKAVSLDDKEKGIHYGEVYYELLHIKDGGDEKTNGVDLTNLSEALDEMNTKIEDEVASNVSEFKSDYSDDDIYYDDQNKNYAEFSHTENIYIERADDDVVSVMIKYYDYMGGAHGSSAYQSYCFDTKSGQEITFSDIISDTTGLEDKVITNLKEQYPELFENNDDSTFSPEQTARDDINELVSNPEKQSTMPWILTTSGIEFVFGEYELGPYAAGSQFVLLPYDDNKDMYNQEISYDEIPDGTLLRISSDGKTIVNGKTLEIKSTYDEENGTNGFSAYYDGNEMPLNSDENAYMAYSYIARRGEKYFLLMEFSLDNGIPDISIYDLASGKELPTQFEYSLSNGLNFDLNNLTITRRLDALSTVDAAMTSTFTSDGLIVPNEKEYTILSSFGLPNAKTPFGMAHILTAKKDIRCIDGTIEEGEKVKLVKTNADEKAQTITLMKKDKSTVNVLVETKEDGTHTIDGTDENELFDGIFYSG